MSVKELKGEDFEKEIGNKKGKAVVDCFASWCGPCKMLSPIIDEVSEELKDYKFYKLDVDENEEFDKEFGIMAMPTLLVFENGKLTKRQTGFVTKDELIEFLK